MILACQIFPVMGGILWECQPPILIGLAKEGKKLTSFYGQLSCTAGRAAFITGQLPVRTGLTTVGIAGTDLGLQPEDPTLAEVLKTQGYNTAQFGKNHLGDLEKFMPHRHGFDEFFGNLYHLNANEIQKIKTDPILLSLRKSLILVVLYREHQMVQQKMKVHLQ